MESPRYKFKHTFYNISSSPNLGCVPVLIKGHKELNNRIKQQNLTVAKLEDACKVVEVQLNHLIAKASILRNKIDECVTETRKLFSLDGDLERIFKLKKMMLFKPREGVSIDKEKKDNLVQILSLFKEMLMKMKLEMENKGF